MLVVQLQMVEGSMTISQLLQYSECTETTASSRYVQHLDKFPISSRPWTYLHDESPAPYLVSTMNTTFGVNWDGTILTIGAWLAHAYGLNIPHVIDL